MSIKTRIGTLEQRDTPKRSNVFVIGYEHSDGNLHTECEGGNQPARIDIPEGATVIAISYVDEQEGG